MNDSEIKNLAARIEALLFLSHEPITAEVLMEACSCSDAEVLAGISALSDRLDRCGSSIELREMASGYQLFTRAEQQEFLEEYIASNDRRKLSTSSIETLAIVAYCQPVTRSQISEIRGVNSDGLLTGLINKGFVCEVGVAQDCGAALFATTNLFLDSLGILDLSELPDLEGFAPDAEARIAIAERLGAIRSKNTPDFDN